MEPNSADVAKVLLDAGAEVNASTIASYPADTMGLVVTSKQASDANVAGPLIDVLLQYGARLDLTSDDCLDPSLATYAGGSLIIVAFALLAKEELGHGKH